ncbi:hypothetical protein PRUPE_1G416900 [Prunus persica]|uniref:Uncharacterized protein n=1 Tax=Prunus persica TaxID=3760 RepID=A0A251RB97_PRUPE|nr:hypothetical protein PRUPE_1G416900 [Prunus persica]
MDPIYICWAFGLQWLGHCQPCDPDQIAYILTGDFACPTGIWYVPDKPTKTKNSQTSELPDTTWDNLGFDKTMSADYMFIMKSSEDRSFSDGGLQRFGKIKLNPAACVLNYGQGIIEELKAYRKPENSILLFRPEEHGLRMRVGAERLLMPAPTVEQFVEAVKVTVLENRRWVPSPNKGFLHIRPLLIGSGPVLSLTPAPEFIFLILVTPMGDYSRGGLEPINLVVENEIHHAFHGGAGSVKLCCCNFHLPLIHIALSGCLSIGLPVGALWSFWHSHCLAIHKEASADCWKMATTNHPGSYHFL